MYRLLSATPSPYARKVRIALAEKGIPFELVTEVPWDSDTSTPRYNPLEKLPVLICDDGTSVYESRYILEWLEVKHPEPRLMPRGPDEILAAKRFEVLADGVCDAGVLLFWERARDPEKRSPQWAARQERKMHGGVREISRLLAERDYCVGGAFTLADVAVGSLLRWLEVRVADIPWRQQYPNLVALSDRLEQRPSFRDSVPSAQSFRDKVA
jgi:glutathione S-transferase